MQLQYQSNVLAAVNKDLLFDNPDTFRVFQPAEGKIMSKMMIQNNVHETIMRNIPLGFLLVNRDGVIIEFNEVAETITGFAKYEVIGKSHCNFFHCNSGANTCLLLEPGWELCKNIVENESSFINKKGKEIIISATIFPLKDDNGHFLGAVELFRDISRRSKMERERKNILAMFAHDIKNPAIASALFTTRILRDRACTLTECQKSCLDIVHENITKIIDYTDDFLTFSLFDEKQYLPEKRPYDVVAAILQVIESEKAVAEKKQMTIDFNLPVKSLVISADKKMLDRVTSNLLDNALKYSISNGTITITVIRQSDGIHLSVADAGIGIPDESIPYIFEPFFRVNNGCRGTGLGLAISKSIIEAHEGQIYVESRLGKGSTFHCILPSEVT